MNFSFWPFLWFGLLGRLLKFGESLGGSQAPPRTSPEVLVVSDNCHSGCLQFLRGSAFALFCAHLRISVLICVFLCPTVFSTTAFGNCRDFPGSPPSFPGSFSATSPEVLSLWNLTAIQRFPGSFPDFPGSSPDFPGSFPDFPGGQPLSLGSLTPSSDSQKLPLISRLQERAQARTKTEPILFSREPKFLAWLSCRSSSVTF